MQFQSRQHSKCNAFLTYVFRTINWFDMFLNNNAVRSNADWHWFNKLTVNIYICIYIYRRVNYDYYELWKLMLGVLLKN